MSRKGRAVERAKKAQVVLSLKGAELDSLRERLVAEGVTFGQAGAMFVAQLKAGLATGENRPGYAPVEDPAAAVLKAISLVDYYAPPEGFPGDPGRQHPEGRVVAILAAYRLVYGADAAEHRKR